MFSSMKRSQNTPGPNLAQEETERESRNGAWLGIRKCIREGLVWTRRHQALSLIAFFVGVIALVPLYGVLFPPLVDLSEHMLMSKLLWEKLSGVSHLDLEIPFFLGYRLFPALTMVIFLFCKLWGISFVNLPMIVAIVLVSLHAIFGAVIVSSGLRDRSWKSCVVAVCFSIPAVASMYSASWFIGFVNYTLAITVLMPAIWLTDRFVRSGRSMDACWLFLALLLVYMAHPFALTFWLLWCLGRAIATVLTWSLLLEWKRLILLGVLFLPIFLYHYWATAGTPLAPSGHPLMSQWPFLSSNQWYQNRLPNLLRGAFLKADDASDSSLFGIVALGVILFATVLAFCSPRNRSARTVMVATVFLLVASSWIDEKCFPVPTGFWLAYDYRYSSTVYAICLVFSGMVLVSLLPAPVGSVRGRMVFAPVAFLSLFASVGHLVEVRKAYTRFDGQARKYMAKIFNHEQPAGIDLPHSQYHPDGSFLKDYICLMESDCVPPASTFAIFSNGGFSGNLYPVKLRVASSPPVVETRRRGSSLMPFPSSLVVPFLSVIFDDGLVGYWRMDEPNARDACVDSSGYENTGTPRGTTVVEGKIARSRNFNGTSDYIDLPTISTPVAITVSAWVYSDTFLQNGFIITKNPVNTQWALFFDADGTLKWRGAGSEKNIACAAPANQKWHHLVGKQSGTTGSLYVDGVLCSTGTLPAIGNAPSSISIGRYDTVSYNYFYGRIDEVRIYKRALSDAEISRIFRSGNSRVQGPVSSPSKETR